MKTHLVFLIGLVFFQNSVAQEKLQSSISDAMQQAYFNEVNQNALLRFGVEYHSNDKSGDAHPFYQSRNWTLGRVNFNGTIYDNVSLKYDLDQRVLISFRNDIAMILELRMEAVNEFSLWSTRFERIDSFPGFWTPLVIGPSSLYVRLIKDMEDVREYPSVVRTFPETKEYLVKLSNQWKKINNRRDLMKLLGIEETQFLSKQISDQEAYQQLVEYYNSENQ